MKKTILAASLALALSVGRSQTAEPEVLIYNGPQCGTHYYGVNGTDIITSFRNFLESALILYSSDKAWWGWSGLAQSRRDKFAYRPSNICAQCQHRLVTFERVDISAMGVRAVRGLKQTLAYAKATAGLDGSPAKWQAYYNSFFDGYRPLEFSRRRVAKTLVDESGFYSGIESMRTRGLLLFSVNADTLQTFTQPLDNFRGEFQPDTSRDPVVERHWWLDESTGQMESFVFSIRLPALGAQPWAYVIFQNYFMCESQYTSLNGVEVPVAMAFVESLYPRPASRRLMPDSFAVIDEWDSERGRHDRDKGHEKFQAAYQVSEFMLLQRRNALFGKGHDPVSDSAYRFELVDGLAQGRVSKVCDGGVVWSAEFSGGRPDGDYESFYPGGSRRESGSFRAGKVDGRWVSRYPGGSVESERGYSNGVKSGSYRTYYPGGALRESYFFRSDGTKSAEFYYEDGTLMEKGEIDREDRATGVWEYKVKFSDSFWNWFSAQAEAWDDGLKCGLDGAVCQMDTAARALMFRVEYRQKLEYISQTGGKGSRPMSVVDTQIKVLSW